MTLNVLHRASLEMGVRHGSIASPSERTEHPSMARSWGDFSSFLPPSVFPLRLRPSPSLLSLPRPGGCPLPLLSWHAPVVSMKHARPLTKASVLRALKRHKACPDAIRWFRRQRGSLRQLWNQLVQGLPHRQRMRCWVQKKLNRHVISQDRINGSCVCVSAPVSFEEISAVAARRGWNR